jgi:PKHD-type hydroxylase
MNLEYIYWTYKNVIPHKVCDDIIKYYEQKKEKEILGIVGSTKFNKNTNNLNKEEIKKLKKIRNSNIIWTEELWMSRYIMPYIKMANKNANWNFQLDNPESFQLTKYSVNGHYDWHCDSWNEPYKEGKYANKIRKLSMTVSLSNKTQYEGGELQFAHGNDNLKEKNKKAITCKEIFSKGSLVVFPSFIWHKVQPVTKGNRYSLVVWNLGNPFL